MSAAGDREAGVTLLEALVVIAVVALIAALIAPNMRTSLDVLSLRQSAAVLQADLRVAHATAMRTGNPVTVSLVQGNIPQTLKWNPEEVALSLDSYRDMITYFGNDDPTSRRMLEGILAMEEEHAEDLGSLLEKMT